MSPARPGQFNAVVLRSIKKRANDLQEISGTGQDYQEEIDRLPADIQANTDEVLTTPPVFGADRRTDCSPG